MAYTAEDVGLLDADGSYIDSNDDDLGFEIDDCDNPHFSGDPWQGRTCNNRSKMRTVEELCNKPSGDEDPLDRLQHQLDLDSSSESESDLDKTESAPLVGERRGGGGEGEGTT